MFRTSLIKVRVSSEEKAAVAEKAAKVGMNVAQFTRALWFNAPMREAPKGDWYDAVRELKRIGNNLNQLAHIANSFGAINAQEYHDNAAMVRDAVLRMERGEPIGNFEDDSADKD